MQLGGCAVVVSSVIVSALLSGYVISALRHQHAQPQPSNQQRHHGNDGHPGNGHHGNGRFHNGRAVHDAATQTSRDSSSLLYDDDSALDDGEDDGLFSRPLTIAATKTSGRYKNLMIVSTLDGKLSALDADTGGALLWSINVGAKPLLSSSISSLEVVRNGRNSRLIPSLDGSLYQFNGDDMERLPFNADTLLSSSAKLTEDTMVVGSRDVSIFGICPYTGQVKYICGSDGCGRNHDHHSHEDIITIRRKSHTVRAIHIASGEEKWNFSVGQHEIEFLDGFSSDNEDTFFAGPTVPVKVFVPDGVVIANSDGDLDEELWRYQFASPITKAWRLLDGGLEEISMFDCKYVPTLHDGRHVLATQPMIYFGMHQGQLYVQPSVSGADHPHVAIDDYLRSFVHHDGNELARRVPKIRWKPYLSTAPSRTPHMRHMVNLLDYDRHVNKEKAHPSTDEDYPYDSGYYLIPDITYLPDYIPELEYVDEGKENETDYLIYINESIWVWWKEIIAISLCTSILVQVLMNKVLFRPRDSASSESSQKERTISESSRSDEADYQRPGVSFVSRFHTDFDVLETLGRGGFGVVFKAKNKMDELEYAVKRICVKNTPESREKVLREARAMAKLEHVGIIRYYQVFVETPPVGWQRVKDLELFGPDVTSTMSTSRASVTPSSPARSLLPETISRKLKNPLHLFDDRSEEELSKAEYNRSNSLEVVFEHSDSVPFRRYRNSENQCDSGCSDVSTHKEEAELNLSSFTGNSDKPEATASLTSGSGSFSLHNDEQADAAAVVEKPPKLYLYIQMQLCERQTLKDWLSANTLKRDCHQMLDYFTQIVHAVAYVHENSLIHRDLKPSNIYFSVNDNNIIKIGDFGLVTAHEQESAIFDYDDDSAKSDVYKQHTNQVGTQLYMSPEQMNGLPYDQKVDIFSLGLIFLEFFYPCCTQMEKISVLSEAKRGSLPARFVRELRKESQFVSWLLSEEASQRPSAVEMLESELLRDVVPSSMVGHRRTNSIHLRHRKTSQKSKQ